VQGYEVVKRVFLEPELFSVENDLLTPSFKLKRPQLQKRYQAEIDRMYAEINAPKK
jgi:long-chain acyl-CoA synthetase